MNNMNEESIEMLLIIKKLDEFVCDGNVWRDDLNVSHIFVRYYFTVCYRCWYPFTL